MILSALSVNSKNPILFCSENCRQESGYEASDARWVRYEDPDSETVCTCCGGLLSDAGK